MIRVIKHLIIGLLFLLGISSLLTFNTGCQSKKAARVKIRTVVDTVGFSHKAEQMDQLMRRIDRLYGDQRGKTLQTLGLDTVKYLPLAISPHDDYTYAGDVYTYVLSRIHAPLLFMIGVAHKARRFNLQDSIVFGTFTEWQAPYGPVKISPVREEILKILPTDTYVVHDSMMAIEHSLEALIPFLQYYNKNFQIVPILVPYMSFNRMKEIALPLAKAIRQVATEHHWRWGKDYAIVISTDAVHYGDRDWGGRNFAYFGADSAGYQKAVKHEFEIIQNCLTGALDLDRIRKFTEYTVQKSDYHKYKWTWCGRYSVPFGLTLAYYLSRELQTPPLNGVLLKYSTSIAHSPIPVSDLKMGITAPANIHHWVGYAAIAYRF